MIYTKKNPQFLYNRDCGKFSVISVYSDTTVESVETESATATESTTTTESTAVESLTSLSAATEPLPHEVTVRATKLNTANKIFFIVQIILN